MTLILSGTDGLSDVDGSAATPAIRGSDANTGIFFGTDIIGFSEGGVEAARFNASGVFTTTNDATIQGLTVGRGAGAVSTNTAVGVTALAANTTGDENVGVGHTALNVTTTGSANTAVGSRVMRANTTGGFNAAVGYNSLLGNTTGQQNTALGASALQSTTTASDNTAVGYQAGYSNTTGTANAFVGTYAGLNVTTGSECVAVGKYALSVNTTGSNNTAIGRSSLGANTTASSNTAVGYQTLYSNTTGTFNCAFGATDGARGSALYSNTTGGYSTAFGNGALANSTTGSFSIGLGFQAGGNITTGSGGVYVGYAANASAVGVNYEMVISTASAGSTGKGTNTGFINPNGGGVYQGNNSGTWTQVSDRRLKKNIADNTDGLSKIASIRVRNFEYLLPDEVTELPQDQAIAKTGVQLGVIAQELQAVLPECVKTESTGLLTVDTDNLTWYLINAVKELTARVAQLEGK